MVLRIFILLLACSFASCKKESKKGVLSGGNVYDDSDGSMQPYVDTFMVRLAVAGLTPDTSMLTVNFTDSLPSNVLGSCTMGFGIVKINRALWKTLNSAHREELIFHELGHCVLDRLHDTTLVGGIPKSVMYPYHLGPTVYAADARYAGYQAELFGVDPLLFFTGYLFDASLYGLGLSAESEPSLQPLSAYQQIFFCPDH